MNNPITVMGKEIAIGLSFANLCYLRVWSELLTYTPAQTYEMRLPPGPQQYLAAALNVVSWGVVLGVLATKLRPASPAARRAAQWVFLVALLVPLNALREVLASRLPFGQQYLKGGLYAALGPAGLAVVGVCAFAGGALALHRWRQNVFCSARAALLILVPFAPLTLAQATWKACRHDPAPFRDGATAARIGSDTQPARRVVWVIFDEWDQRLTFDERPRELALPEIDRLREEAFAARNAYPPAAATLESMPSLITGRVAEAAAAGGTSELRVTFAGESESRGWGEVWNVFDEARRLGFDTALEGAYHPYCRVLAESLTACSWMEMPRPINSSGDNVVEAMRGQTRSLLETWRLSVFGQSLSTERKARVFPEALERAKRFAADGSYGFVLLHLLTPHFPHAYDRATGRFTLGNAPLGGYYDSLALTDRSLGELRRAMEAAGVWETTTLLLSSDHAMRHAVQLGGKPDPRVPFLLKLAGQSENYAYEPKIKTVVTAGLLLNVLRGGISEAGDVARWLDRSEEPPAWPTD